MSRVEGLSLQRRGRRAAGRAALALALVWMATAVACRRAPPERLKVAVSVFAVGDLVRRVAGPDADVVVLVPSGSDPTTFVPGDGERAASAGARLGVMVGLGLDEWMDPVLKGDGNPRARTVRVGDRVPTVAAAARSDGAGAADPFVWMDPARGRLIVRVAADELARADSSHAADYRARAAALDTTLEALDREIEALLAPAKGKAVAVSPTRLAYLADRYGFTAAGGAQTQGSPGAPLAQENAGGAASGAPPAAESYEAVIRAAAATVARAYR